MRKTNEYTKQAKEFLEKAGATLSATRIEIVDRFPNDTTRTGYRWCYRVRINRGGRSYSFKFYDSVLNYERNERPTAYDILACVEKYEPYGDVWDFASEYGYSISSRDDYNRVTRIYNACKRQYTKLLNLFGADLMQELQDIN